MWAEVKLVINTTLGTNNAESLDEIFEEAKERVIDVLVGN